MLNINNNFRHEKCPLCGLSCIYVGDINYSSPLHFSNQKISLILRPELWECKNCKSGFVQNVIPEVEAATLYAKGDAGERWSTTLFEKSKSNEIIEVLNSLLVKGLNVLDIGCNTGELLDFAKKRGCQTFGVEYSFSSLSLLKAKGHTTFSKLDNVNGYYDVITAFDLVEHIYNLPAFLDTCYKKLSPNGYLVFLTGDISSITARLTGSNWWYTRFPEHIVFPSKTYFDVSSKFQVVKWVPTYAAIEYKKPVIKVLKSLLRKLLTGSYAGLPSLGPDHVLVVLKSKE